jgi:hypothetical protein
MKILANMEILQIVTSKFAIRIHYLPIVRNHSAHNLKIKIMVDAPHQTPAKIVFGMEFVLTSFAIQIRKMQHTQNVLKNSA